MSAVCLPLVAGAWTRPAPREQTALDLALPIGNLQLQVTAELQLSSIAHHNGNAEAATHYAEEALTLARANGIENLITCGLLDQTHALQYFQHAGSRKKASKALILLGRARRDSAEYQAALQAFPSSNSP